MATTTNYGWTTPDDTALVKDGASAIRALGTAIDTSMNTALGTRKAGMVLLNTTSFSGVSSQNLTSFITSTYDKYHIQIDCVASTGAQMYFRFRSTTTDKATEYYGAGFQTTFAGTTGSVQTKNNGTEGYLGAINTTSSFIEADIFKYDGSRGLLKGLSLDQSAAAAYYFGYANNNIGGSFDGITIYPSAGTITGKISIFGWNK